MYDFGKVVVFLVLHYPKIQTTVLDLRSIGATFIASSPNVGKQTCSRKMNPCLISTNPPLQSFRHEREPLATYSIRKPKTTALAPPGPSSMSAETLARGPSRSWYNASLPLPRTLHRLE